MVLKTHGKPHMCIFEFSWAVKRKLPLFIYFFGYQFFKACSSLAMIYTEGLTFSFCDSVFLKSPVFLIKKHEDIKMMGY